MSTTTKRVAVITGGASGIGRETCLQFAKKEAAINSTDDRQYWIKKPTANEFDDCCNEFWMVWTYVVKGLARKEILFAIDHLNEIARPNLLRMMAWQIGSAQGYTFSVGKNYKFINRYLPREDWEELMSTSERKKTGYRPDRQPALTAYPFSRQADLGADRTGVGASSITNPKYSAMAPTIRCSKLSSSPTCIRPNKSGTNTPKTPISMYKIPRP